MPFGRLHEEAAGDSKLLALSNAAWRMWGMGLIYCQKNLTDGFIPVGAIHLWGVRGGQIAKVADELCTSQVPGKAALWEPAEGGYQVHDYLQWNDSKSQILAWREVGKTRRQLYGNVELLAAIRERDGSTCRYCGRPVNWRDRRGPGGATYDHVNPKGGNTLDNLAIACRGCNSSKGTRTPEECGMRLLPAPNPDPIQYEPRSDSKSLFEIEHTRASGSGTWNVDQEKEGDVHTRAPARASGRSDGALAGSLPKNHTHHAACDATFSRCVPQAVHDKLANLLAPKHNGDRIAAATALHAWYPTVWATLPAVFVMGDEFKFWQGRFDQAFASKEAATDRRQAVPTVDASRARQRRMREEAS